MPGMLNLKRGLLIAVLLAIALPATAFAQASAVLRQGVFIDQYAIDDPGNASGFDNNRIFISHQVNEVVIQVSGANLHTSSEALLCWDDPEILECPDDDLGGGVFRMPVLTFLNDIQIAGGVTVGAPLTDLQEKSRYLAFWHEYRTKKMITDSIAEMVTDGLNALQQKRALKYIYFGNGIDIVTAKTLADNRIDFGTIATYGDYNLATIPLQDRRLLKLFGEVGWFE